MSLDKLEAYLIRHKGMYLVGSNRLTADINKARIYHNMRTIRTHVTLYANKHQDEAVPEILKLKVTGFDIIDETDRVNKARLKYRQEQHVKEQKDFQRKLDYNKLVGFEYYKV